MSTPSILVVDDDAAICRVLARMLTAEGYGVATVADGGSALVELERHLPDLIVLDVGMPGLDGLAVARRVRAKGVAVPILMLTARDDVADRVAGLDAGGDDYLVKPFATDELLARVRALLAPRAGPVRDRLVRQRHARCRGAARGALRSVDPAHGARGRSARAAAAERPPRDHARAGARRASGATRAAATANVVDRYVTNLRRKLGEPALIRTVRGLGFAVGE